MKIEHIGLWVSDLETMRRFYQTYFDAQSNNMYHNPTKQFKSYFLTFASGARLELMQQPTHQQTPDTTNTRGWAHIAFSVGSKQKVDELTALLQHDGYIVISQPRTTGDGYYESLVADPEGNHVEITV